MTPWERREQKRQWALNNPDKVRLANQRCRAARQSHYNSKAAERMRRYRLRRRQLLEPKTVSPGSPPAVT